MSFRAQVTRARGLTGASVGTLAGCTTLCRRTCLVEPSWSSGAQFATIPAGPQGYPLGSICFHLLMPCYVAVL